MNRDEKLKTFKWIKLKHSIRFIYLNLTFDIDSFKEFYLQNQYFLDGRTLEEMYKEFTYFQFIDLCKKWMVYPCLNKQEIIDFYDSEMGKLINEG